MAQSGSSSYLANLAQRRRGLVRVREALLDRPGIQREGGPPPPTVPAQNRESPQEKALRERNLPLKAEVEQQVPAEQADKEQPAHLFDDDTRARLMEQAAPFLEEVRKQKAAELHRQVGRVRYFFGGGL